MSDRTIHARTGEGRLIVRYGRAGKWYIEDALGGNRQALSLMQAVWWATQPGAVLYLGRLGGSAFDRKVRASASDEERT